jgi:hypothetical protein
MGIIIVSIESEEKWFRETSSKSIIEVTQGLAKPGVPTFPR